MNLRIEEQSLRFRMSKEELKILCSGSGLVQQTFLPNQHVLNIDMTTQAIENILQVTFEEGCMKLSVQKNAAENLYHALPSREGLRDEQKINETHTLELILEVDIRTQKRNRDKR